MHSGLIVILALLLVFGTVTGFGVSRSAEVFTLAVLVAAIGVPHGALDHVAGHRLFGPTFGRFWWLLFFTAYLVAAILVVLGWYVMPKVTILIFFLVSAWHFGLEDRNERKGNWTRHLTAIATGGLIIWLPSLSRGSDVTELLSIVMPNFESATSASCVTIVATSAIILGPICILDCLLRDMRLRRSGQSSVHLVATSNSLRVLSVGILCIVGDPLIAFTVYFCGWHSVRGLFELARSQRESAFVMFRKLLPLTSTALGLVAAGACVWSTTGPIESSLIRTVFIGLSALAVPHLCLHVVDDILRRRAAEYPLSNVGGLNRA